MKNIISFWVKNSILVNFITVFVLVVGVMSIFSIQKELRPAVSIDKINISTIYTGASSKEIEKLITIPLEEDLSVIYGVERIQSLSFTGVSQISIDIDPDVGDKQAVIQEIFRAVENVRDLPEDSEKPSVREIKSQIFPIYGVALYGEADPFELRIWARLLKDELEVLSGVSSVDITGVRDPTIEVVVDPMKLEQKSISVSEIMNSLKEWNKAAPAGFIRDLSREIPVRIDENLDEIKKIEDLIVRINDMEKGVKIREIGTVRWGFKNDRKINRYNGKNNVQLSISKKENADTIKTVDIIREVIDKFQKKLPEGMKTIEYRDDSSKIKTKLASVTQNAGLGLLLVVVALLLMLNWRIALVTALGLPIALFGSIWALEFLGHTLNSMTIIGIILVVGMLVDDGIVVAENIFYHFEQGKNRIQAAIDGTTEIIIPVIGTVLTTIVAFLPLVFISGIMGKFIAIIPIGVITCLVFSLLECILILPNHAAEFMGIGKSNLSEKLNLMLENLYKPALHFAVRRRWPVTIFLTIAVVGLTIYYVKTFTMQLFPVKGITSFSFNIEAPANTRLNETDKIVKNIEEKMIAYMGKYITGYMTNVGSIDGRMGLAYFGPNTAGFKIYMVDEEEMDINPTQLVKRIREEISPLVPDKWELSFEVGRHGPPMGKAVEIEVSHAQFEKIDEVAALIKKKLYSIKGTADVKDDQLRGFKEYILKINQKKAAIFGISPSVLQKVTMSAFEGIAATKVRKLDDEYDLMVLYPAKNRENKLEMLDLKVKTQYGTYVPISTVASLEEMDAIGAIEHIDSKRTVVVMSSLLGDVTAYEINKEMEKFVKNEVTSKYPDVKINFGGEEQKRREMMSELLKLFVIALLAIYMILSLVFNSAIYPFFVILIIPFGFVGAISALKMYGEIVSFPALVSLVGLTGVVVNDAIILVTYIRDQFSETGDMINSILRAGLRRIRPIFLTTFTTFMGLLPSIYELGGQDANMKPMAIVIAWGLLFATIITMLFIPGFMACLFDIKNWFKKWKTNKI